ncbi:MAG: dATP pyrophosphohydrolase [Parasphingorhabdus sp.]|jgi:dATP pyrophosphohydrolase
MSAKHKRPESVLVVVYTATNRILLLNRQPPAFWQSITGSMSWAESDPIQTAQRELWEETRIKVAPGELTNHHKTEQFEILANFRHRYKPGTTHNLEFQFSLRLPAEVDVRIEPREHSEYRWVNLDEARRLIWSWSNLSAVENLFN